jgi:hypothetical protein
MRHLLETVTAFNIGASVPASGAATGRRLLRWERRRVVHQPDLPLSVDGHLMVKGYVVVGGRTLDGGLCLTSNDAGEIRQEAAEGGTMTRGA